MFKTILNKIYLSLDNSDRKELARANFTKALELSYKRGYETAETIGIEKLNEKEEDLRDEYSIILASKEIELQQLHKTVKDYKEH